MRPMKVAGIEDIRSARARVVKLHGMDRVLKKDMEIITKKLDEVEAHIVAMTELGEDGEEVCEGA